MAFEILLGAKYRFHYWFRKLRHNLLIRIKDWVHQMLGKYPL